MPCHVAQNCRSSSFTEPILRKQIDLSENIMFLLQSLLIHIQGNIHVDNFEMVCKVLK